MQAGSRPAGVGGVPWTERETRDLISVWAEKLVQALRTCRRKTMVDGFQRVAEQMAGRGHRRSAQECWTKIGALRVAYRRAFTHNVYRRWATPQTCPFYSQLDRILKGDGIPKPFILSSSLRVRVQMEPDPPPINTDEVRGSSSAASVPLEIPVSETVAVNAEKANKTVTEELENAESLNRRECQNAPTPPTRIEQEVSDGEMGVAQLSPASCLANAQVKRKSVSGLHDTEEHVAEQPSKRRGEKPGPLGKGTRKSQRLAEKGCTEVRRSMRSRGTAMKK